ncbi:MAG: hypothetical protein UW70_C0104G0006 [Candidatus Peregrinibacteria bacterium GW2011_GWA2_44_7]|nr:MAG: hypothetical protein UW70_C0104G0006 [Candidatus Peregrinibacteria bacterium GW2011_GWA2_44_7]
MSVKQSAAFESDDLVLVLNEVSDSRCPADVQCIRAGEVVVKASVFKGEERLDDVTLQLAVGDQVPAQEGVGDYRIELVEVTPYPKSGVAVTPEQYQVTFKVAKEQ